MNPNSYQNILKIIRAFSTETSKPIVISPTIFKRDFLCRRCGACCNLKFTKDWIPTQNYPPEAKLRIVENNIKIFFIGEPNKGCQFYDPEHMVCSIYSMRPLHCKLPPGLQIREYSDRNILMTAPYGRGSLMTRWDGTRGADCGFFDRPRGNRKRILTLLRELLEWAEWFKIETRLMEVYYAIQSK